MPPKYVEPLSQTSTFYCILASSRSGSAYLGEFMPPKYVEPLPQTYTFYCILASSRSGSTYLGEFMPPSMWSCSC